MAEIAGQFTAAELKKKAEAAALKSETTSFVAENRVAWANVAANWAYLYAVEVGKVNTP